MGQRKRRSRDAARISLFSLLDVLLCSMGVLIVLLAMVLYRAQAQAREQVSAAVEKTRHEDESARQARAAREQQLDQRAQDLQSQAATTAAELDAKRRAAARLQVELEEAQRKLQHLEEQRRDLDRLAKERPSDEQLRRQLAELDERLRQAQAILSDRQRAAAAPPQELYSIIPYAGRNGTPRRPIYIECRGDRVVIQPEGTELTQEDFAVRGHGNPLEAAVRVTVAYWGQAGQTDFYPLLLVRPEGVKAYQAAHASLRPWGREFGYELVENDWKMAYPPADPVLAQQQQAAVEMARAHMRAVAKEDPGRRRSAPVYRIGMGSLERMGYGGDDDDDDFGSRGGRRGLAGNNNRGAVGRSGSGSSPNGTAGPGTPGQGAGPGNSSGQGGIGPDGASGRASAEGSVFAANGNGSADNPLGTRFINGGPQGQGLPYRPPGQFGAGPGPSNGFDIRPGAGRSQADRTGAGNASRPFGAIGSQFDRVAGGGGQGQGTAGASGPGGARGASAGNSDAAGNESGSGSGPPDGRSQRGSFGPGGTGAMPTAGGMDGGGGQSGPRNPMSPDAMPDEQPSAPALSMNARMTSVARTEGANWALPSKPGRGLSPLRRPVELMVDEGAITVFADPRTAQTLQIIRFSPDPAQITGELKDAIWKVMKDWGNPPAGFHWRPVLRARVTHRGAARFDQLDALLQDSGFELAGQR